MTTYKNIVFDLGGVLIDWNPEYLYRKIITDVEKRQWFLDNVCTMEWNVQQDAGRSWAEATSILSNEYPEWKSEIVAYFDRWVEMLNGPIQGTVKILEKFHHSEDHRIFALTNWSAETFPYALERYDFLQWFEGIVVSGEEKTRKPFKKIYKTLLDRYDLEHECSIFIDDNKENIQAAESVGIKGVHFSTPEMLQEQLEVLGIL